MFLSRREPRAAPCRIDGNITVSLDGQAVATMPRTKLEANPWFRQMLDCYSDSPGELSIDSTGAALEDAKLVFALWEQLHPPQDANCLGPVQADQIASVLSLCDFFHIILEPKTMVQYLRNQDLHGNFEDLFLSPARFGQHDAYLTVASSAYIEQVRQEMQEGFRTKPISAFAPIFFPTAHRIVGECGFPPDVCAGTTPVWLQKLSESLCPPLEFDSDCVICLSEFSANETVKSLPCGHAFHDTCIAAWRNDCPLCRETFEHTTTVSVTQSPRFHHYVKQQLENLQRVKNMEYIDLIQAIGEQTIEKCAFVEKAQNAVNHAFTPTELCVMVPSHRCRVGLTGRLLRKLPRRILHQTQQKLLQMMESEEWQVDVQANFADTCPRPPFGLFDKDPDVLAKLPFLNGFPWDGVGMKVVLGGGALLHCFTDAGFDDLDLYFIRDTSKNHPDIGRTLERCIHFVTNASMPCQWLVIKNPRTVSLIVRERERTLNYQFVMTLFPSMDAKLMFADVSCTELSFDGTDIYMTPHCLFSFLTGYNDVHNTYQSPSRNFKQLSIRLAKYATRGFGVAQRALPKALPPPSSSFYRFLEGPLGWKLLKLATLGQYTQQETKKLGALSEFQQQCPSSFEDRYVVDSGPEVAEWLDEKICLEAMGILPTGSGVCGSSHCKQGLGFIYDALHCDDWQVLCIKQAKFYSVLTDCIDRQTPIPEQDAAFYGLWEVQRTLFSKSMQQLCLMGNPVKKAQEALLLCPSLTVEDALDFVLSPSVSDQSSMVDATSVSSWGTPPSSPTMCVAFPSAANASVSQTLLHDDSQREALRLSRVCEEAESAPGGMPLRQCLLPGTMVRVRRDGTTRVVSISSLVPKDVLVSGCSAAAVVRTSRSLPQRDRDVVSVNFQSAALDSHEHGSLLVTAYHLIPVLLPRSKQYKVLHAFEILPGSHLRTHVGEAVVVSLEKTVQNIAVTEIEFEDAHSSMYVNSATGDAVEFARIFIEVYGTLAPCVAESVKLLHFSRFERFRQELLQGPDLQACRDDLQRHGFSADLDVYDLGPGKMFVQPQIAAHVLAALTQKSDKLRAGDVVVSRVFEHIVLEVVRRRQGVRAAYVMKEEPVELSPSFDLWPSSEDLHLRAPCGATLVVRRTFLSIASGICEASDSRSIVVTCSTSDVHTHLTNPRRL